MVYNILQHAHSGLRWVVLILLLAAVWVAVRHLAGRRADYTEGNRKLYLFALIATHIQVTGGLLLYLLPAGLGSPKVNFSLAMDKFYRFYTVEHITAMLIAVVLITIGHSRQKRAADALAKHKQVAIFMGLGLLIILLSIPWPGRVEGAGWF